MTAMAPSVNANNFFKKAEQTILDLACRWQDEKEYENIKDYKLPLMSIADRYDVVITKMNKRPFGCNFITDDRAYKLFLSGKTYGYKRIK